MNSFAVLSEGYVNSILLPFQSKWGNCPGKKQS